MNRLENRDGYLPTSLEDRAEMIELFYLNGIHVANSTWEDRNTYVSYVKYRVIQWSDGRLGGYRDGYIRDLNILTREEFLIKAGILTPVQGESIIRHKFIR